LANANAANSPSGPSSAVTPIAGKPGGSVRASGQSKQRGALETDAIQLGNQASAAQSAIAGPEALHAARDTAAAQAAIHSAANFAGGSTASAAGPATHDTFAALDAEPTAAMPTWVHAGARQAEVGYQDPVLGWVGVRADASGGGVRASLVPDSADSAQALGGHMAGLNAYLNEQHTPVQSLTVAAPESRSAGLDQNGNQGASQNGSQGGSQEMDQGAGRNSGQGTYTEPQSSARTSSTAGVAADPAEGTSRAGRADGTDMNATARGVHISVMA
jgi:hypothetical protein